MDAKGLARQLQQVHCSAHSSLKKNINSINQSVSDSVQCITESV
jgi:hypothetical protein